jgi:hypothetical protein
MHQVTHPNHLTINLLSLFDLKLNILFCMKVTGETFPFHHKRKGAEEARYQKYPNFQAKGPLPDRTLESFIPKSTDGAIPNL